MAIFHTLPLVALLINIFASEDVQLVRRDWSHVMLVLPAFALTNYLITDPNLPFYPYLDWRSIPVILGYIILFTMGLAWYQILAASKNVVKELSNIKGGSFTKEDFFEYFMAGLRPRKQLARNRQR